MRYLYLLPLLNSRAQVEGQQKPTLQYHHMVMYHHLTAGHQTCRHTVGGDHSIIGDPHLGCGGEYQVDTMRIRLTLRQHRSTILQYYWEPSKR